MDKVATLLPFSVTAPVPKAVEPLKNITVPVGVPPAVLVTVAVNVTDWPATSGLSDETSAVALGLPLTTCLSAGDDVLPLKFASPPYCAVIEWDPMGREDVEKVATPVPFRTPGPSDAVPSKNVTEPVGVPPAVLVTVAVNVTDWPTTSGLSEEASAVALGLPLITCVSVGDDVLPLKVASPPY